MSQFLDNDHDNDDAKAVAIPLVFSKNSQAKKQSHLMLFYLKSLTK